MKHLISLNLPWLLLSCAERCCISGGNHSFVWNIRQWLLFYKYVNPRPHKWSPKSDTVESHWGCSSGRFMARGCFWHTFICAVPVYFAHITRVLSDNLWKFLCGIRGQMIVWSKSGLQMTGACSPRCEDTRLRFPTWPWTTRTRCWPRAAATKSCESGVFEPAPRWLCCRATQLPLLPYR